MRPFKIIRAINAIASTLTNPKATVQAAGIPFIYAINDGATFNQGTIKLDGIDWTFSYDWDMGNLGAFNVGALGTYYLHRLSDRVPTSYSPHGIIYDPAPEIEDDFHTTTGSGNAEAHGVTTQVPRQRWRGRLGWSNGPWNVTAFMDYTAHTYSNQNAPPNVNGTCVSAMDRLKISTPA